MTDTNNNIIRGRKRRKRKLWPWVLAALILVAAAIVFLCLWPDGNKDPNADPDAMTDISLTSSPSDTDTAEPDETQSVQDPDVPTVTMPSAPGIAVETPFGTLYYMFDWQYTMRTEQRSGENLTIAFYGSVGGEELPLFEVIFGNGSAPGHLFGTVTDESGNAVEIRIHVIEFEENAEWTQEELNTAYAMQEEVNSIIGQIYQLPGFVSAN